MSGGLLQIATYGSQDMFLTSSPQITFFKVVYRRYTNFSMESILVNFDNTTGFGKTIDVKLPRIGDLIYRSYLQITLPEILIKRRLPTTNNISELNNVITKYQYILDFMYVNIQAYRNGMENINVINVTPSFIISSIDATYNIGNFLTSIKTNFISTLNGTKFLYSNISFQELMNTLKDINGVVLPTATIDDIKKLLQQGLNLSQRYMSFYYKKLKSLKDLVADQTNPYAKIAWIKKIGHFIVNQIEIYLGGNLLDVQNSYWLDIWYELNKTNNMGEIYNKMIGNIDELTTPSRTKKSYVLYIPIKFWFCRSSGSSLPLVASQYHDVTINIRLKNFHECLYISELTELELNDSVLRKNKIKELKIPDLKNYVEQTGKDLDACLLIDYIFLDTNERKKFAQSSHEYLIEQVQHIFHNNVTPLPISLDLQLNYACKELIWLIQDVSLIKYTDGYNELKWNVYTYNDSHILSNSSIFFNGTSRLIQSNPSFTNYVIPFYFHDSTPSDGINVYSFALYPKEHQPSGSCNMSKISKVILSLNFNKNITNGLFNIHIFCTNYNILRFMSGISGLAFGI